MSDDGMKPSRPREGGDTKRGDVLINREREGSGSGNSGGSGGSGGSGNSGGSGGSGKEGE